MNDQRRQVKKATAQENRVMGDLGGRRHTGSGAAWSRKADGSVNGAAWSDLNHAMVETKRTDKKSYSIKSAELEKLFDEAAMEGRVPLFGIELNGRDYILMETVDYIEVRDRAVACDGSCRDV